jgi:hypothetical protein
MYDQAELPKITGQDPAVSRGPRQVLASRQTLRVSALRAAVRLDPIA